MLGTKKTRYYQNFNNQGVSSKTLPLDIQTMKIRLKFNHKGQTLLEALDSPFNEEQTNLMISKVVKEFYANEQLDTLSELAELIDRDIDYSAILLIATKSLADDIERKRMMKNILNFLDKDDFI